MLPVGMSYKGDWDFLLRLYGSGWKIEYLPVSLITYRENVEGSSSRGFSTFGDVLETMQIVRWHCWSLTLKDVLLLHGRYLDVTLRRTLKAIFWLQLSSAWCGFKAGLFVVWNAVYCSYAVTAGKQESGML